MPRPLMSITLDSDVAAQLRARAKETGEPISRLVEAGVRQLLAMPLAEGEDDDRGLAPTRSERVMLEVLTKAGPGWHHSVRLAELAGVSLEGATKALKALERDGKAFCWGPGRHPVPKGMRMLTPTINAEGGAYFFGDRGTCWGVRPPMAELDRVLKIAPHAREMAIRIAQKMALGVAEIEPFRAACCAAFWPTRTVGGPVPEGYTDLIRNFAELEAEARKEADAESARLEAERLAAPARWAAEQRADDERAARAANAPRCPTCGGDLGETGGCAFCLSKES